MSKCALIVYGSLMSKHELKNEGIQSYNTFPIVLSNHIRQFSQELSYRLVDSQNRAVLRVHKEEGSFLNAILISIDEKDFNVLDKREKGYNKTLVNKENIIDKYNVLDTSFDSIYLYLGKTEKLNHKILPNPSYLDLCLEASKTWGDEFYNDFKNTTFIQNMTLEKFILNT
jgi:gamma-glutamylcyclotransferase (GGCT)/AIG2-like uncharacterized protein YtfP